MPYGRVDEFDIARDVDWPQYVERLEHFFVANGIDDVGKKREVLLSVVGAATYKTLRNILSPEKPGEKTYTGQEAGETLQTCSVGNRRAIQVSLPGAEGWRIDRHVRR